MRFYLFLFLLGCSVLQAQPTILPPAQTDEIIIDNGAAGKADPNDRIRYKVTIQNTGTAGATGTQLNIVPDPRTTFVPGTFRSSPLALADSYACTGNVGIIIPVGLGLKANDFDDNIPGLTITAGTFATTQGGSIMISADGSFNYTPPAGFTGSDTYTYTLNDANGVGGGVPATDMALVTFTVSNLIWFIDNSSVAATSDGRLTSPFKSLNDFNAGSTVVGDLTYIEHTGTNYTGGIVLQDNERVYGEGHTGAANLSGVIPFTLAPNSKTLPNINGTRPIITNGGGDGVMVAMNNNLRGFDVGNCSDFGMDNSGTNSIGNLLVSEVAITNTTGGGFDASNGSGASMNAVFSSISSTGGVNGINLTSCTGTFTVNGGTITNPTGTGVMISGGSVVFNSSGVITDNSGFAVDVDNHDSGNVTFSGNITSTGTGIRVQNCGGGTKLFSGASKSLTTSTNTAVTLSSNTGAIINITGGGLVITTTSGGGFNATGGGTVTVQGSGNTISSTTGTALNVANTTIGASNLTFVSISANGALNGISLNTTGTQGGLTVTGNGNTTQGGNNSGGTIQSTSGDAISLTNSQNVSLTNLRIQNIAGVGNQGISASNLQGSNYFIASRMTNVGSAGGGDANGISLINTSANLTLFSVDNCIFENSLSGTSHVLNNPNGAISTRMDVKNSLFEGLEALAVQSNSASNAIVVTNITNNIFRNAGANGQGGTAVTTAAGSAGSNTFDVSGNTYYGLNNGVADGANAGTAAFQTTGGFLTGTVSNNIIGTALDDNGDRRGIEVVSEPDISVNGFTGRVDITISGNVINRYLNREAIFVDLREDTENSDIIIQNNNIGNLTGFVGQVGGIREAIDVQVRGEATYALDLLLSGNNVTTTSDVIGINLEVNADAASPGAQTLNATVTGNTFVNLGTGTNLTARTRTSDPMVVLCLNMSGNTMEGAAGSLFVEENSGTVNVVQTSSGNLSSVNGNVTVTLVGAPAFGQAPCPQPD